MRKVYTWEAVMDGFKSSKCLVLPEFSSWMEIHLPVWFGWHSMDCQTWVFPRKRQKEINLSSQFGGSVIRNSHSISLLVLSLNPKINSTIYFSWFSEEENDTQEMGVTCAYLHTYYLVSKDETRLLGVSDKMTQNSINLSWYIFG